MFKFCTVIHIQKLILYIRGSARVSSVLGPLLFLIYVNNVADTMLTL